jgi:mannitol-specific phosphotransferase system IIBC component
MISQLVSDSKRSTVFHTYINSLEMPVITVFTVFRLLTDFVCLYTYEFLLSLFKIVRSSVILLLPLFNTYSATHEL